MIKKYNSLILTEYKIVFNPEELDKEFGLTPELRKLFVITLKKVMKKKKNIENDLKQLIEKYPHLPQFKNYLSVHYSLSGDQVKAFEINKAVNKEHPDYLFGKINLAKEYLKNNEVNKVPEILGEAMELKMLYPEREVFHVDEVIAFFNITIDYFLEVDSIEAAETRLKIMKGLENNNPKTKDAEERVTRFKILKSYKSQIDEINKTGNTKFIKNAKYKQTKTAPVFINPEIIQLYQNGFQIDTGILKTILELPREGLIEDLKKVVIDSIQRYKYFKKEIEWSIKTHNFLLHALFLLRELKAEEALDVILDLFRQKVKLLNFWMADALTQDIWSVIYALSQNCLDTLRDFIIEEGNYTYARTEISVAVSQIALNYPERRNEVINWFYFVMNYFIEHRDNETLIDETVIGLMVADSLDLEAKELKETVIKIYKLNLLDEGIPGELDIYLSDIVNKKFKVEIRNLDSLKDTYKDYADFEKSEEKNSKQIFSEDFIEDSQSIFPDLSEEYKGIGRNEKCPCESGLKFKKCHGK